MLLHQPANLNWNLYRACDPWHMHKDSNSKRWEEEYVYIHIRVAHLRFRMHELPCCNQVAQVVFPADVASVLVSAVWVAVVEVHLCLAPPACLGILCCAILPRKAAIRLIFPKHSQLPPHPSFHNFIPVKVKSPLLLFSDLSAWFLHQLLCCLYCAAW